MNSSTFVGNSPGHLVSTQFFQGNSQKSLDNFWVKMTTTFFSDLEECVFMAHGGAVRSG